MLPLSEVSLSNRNPQAEQMASDAMVRTLQAQADAIWHLETPLLERLPLPDGARILDIGCGTGVVTARIAELFPGATVRGVDVHEPHLERAQAAFGHRPNLHFEPDDAYELAEADGSIDLAVCRHVLQSLPRPEQVIAELHRIVRPGGHVHLLVEDYGMIHFAGTARDTDAFWRDVVWAFAASIDNDLRIGRKMGTILRAVGFTGIEVHYLPLDTLRTDRETLAAIWSSWAEAYSPALSRHSGRPLADVLASWQDMVDAIRDPACYALWQVPFWTAVRA